MASASSFSKMLLIGLLLGLFISCTKENKIEKVERAFYHWKSGNSLDYGMQNKLKELEVTKLYVKFFEVDYSPAKGNYPYDKLYSYSKLFRNSEDLNVVPTIFIKNEIFKFNSEKDLDKLADNIVYLINKRCEEVLNKPNNVSEIQIDCDWTKSTKEKYFYFLKKLKALSNKEISCTLRLYPYKYQETMGVPPVDKAMLMCYNLVKPLTNSDKNSILDIEELKSYLNERRNYRVHLDIALPVFSWAQLYQNNHFQKLIDSNSNELKSFTKNIKPMWYEVTKDTSITWNNYYRVGDQIKCEEVASQTLLEAIAVIKKNVAFDKNTSISLFDLDKAVFTKYSNEEISSFYSTFSK